MFMFLMVVSFLSRRESNWNFFRFYKRFFKNDTIETKDEKFYFWFNLWNFSFTCLLNSRKYDKKNFLVECFLKELFIFWKPEIFERKNGKGKPSIFYTFYEKFLVNFQTLQTADERSRCRVIEAGKRFRIVVYLSVLHIVYVINVSNVL